MQREYMSEATISQKWAKLMGYIPIQVQNNINNNFE